MTMIPKKIIEAAADRISLGGYPAKVGKYKELDVFTCKFDEEMTIGLPEVYLWDGTNVKVVSGEEALKFISSGS